MGRRVEQRPENYNLANFREWVDRSRRNLRTDALDLVQLHCPPTAVYSNAEVYDALDTLVAEGAIRNYGVSVERTDEALEAIRHEGTASVQIILNAFRLKPLDEVLPAAKAAGVGIIARVPLASGLLSGKYTKDTSFAEDDHRNFNRDGDIVRRRRDLLRRGLTSWGSRRWPSSSSWCPTVSAPPRRPSPGSPRRTASRSVIPGARNVDQARSNAAAAGLSLDDEVRRRRPLDLRPLLPRGDPPALVAAAPGQLQPSRCSWSGVSMSSPPDWLPPDGLVQSTRSMSSGWACRKSRAPASPAADSAASARSEASSRSGCPRRSSPASSRYAAAVTRPGRCALSRRATVSGVSPGWSTRATSTWSPSRARERPSLNELPMPRGPGRRSPPRYAGPGRCRRGRSPRPRRAQPPLRGSRRRAARPPAPQRACGPGTAAAPSGPGPDGCRHPRPAGQPWWRGCRQSAMCTTLGDLACRRGQRLCPCGRRKTTVSRGGYVQ